MSQTIRVLVLTDHRGHSDQNSIYAILQEMLDHPQCLSIHVSSRGLKENDQFFNANNQKELYAASVNKMFAYSPDGECYSKGLTKVSFEDFDLVFMRLPRPITDDFLRWISQVFKSVPIINNPLGIIETSSKAFLTNFNSVCPHIQLCKSIEEVLAFSKQFPIVLKPLKEYGGKGIVKIENKIVEDGFDKYELEIYLKKIENELKSDGFLAMKFLKNVDEGDKRILVAGGKILAASLRLPPEGSWICNVAQGGKSVPSDVTKKEIDIINTITPKLLEKGIVIFGADTLVDDDGSRVLSEINTLSIGGFPQAQEQTGQPIIKQLIDKIFEYARNFK